MDRFAAIAAFAKVVESGSFVAAADRLDISVSAVSRHVAELEAHLGARLLNRTTRRVSLTESGQAFYEQGVQLLADLEEAEQSAGASAITPRGTLRLSAPVTFGERHLGPAIGEFIARYPDMRFDVELSDRAVDLVDEGFDAAVRIGAIGSQNLVGRMIAETRMVCCAAPAYLARHGEPKRPEDLAGHPCLTYEHAPQRKTWLFRDSKGAALPIKVSGPVHANSGRFLEALAIEGRGIAFEPDFIVGPEVRDGRLVALLRAFQSPPSAVQLVYPSRRHLSAKVRAFAEFLRERFTQAEWMLEPAEPARGPNARADPIREA